MPNENIVYFGDTAHLPYGDKSESAVAHYSEKIAEFLISKKAKTIVIACNTASSYGYDVIQKKFGDKIPILNVIDPMASYVVNHKTSSKIGVIGTKGTIRSGIYKTKIQKLNQKLEVIEEATPLLASLVEENFYNTQISKLILAEYLNTAELKDIDSIVLGCTHYPLLKKDIVAVLGESVNIFDSSEVIAEKLRLILLENNLLGNSPNPKHQFFLSDYTYTFEQNAQMFFGKEIHLEEANIWA